MRLIAFFLPALVFCLLFPGPEMHAANGTWKSTAPNGSWHSASHWSDGNIPGVPGGSYNDNALFSFTSTSQTISIDSGRRLAFITFSGTPGSYTLNGGPLLLTATWPDGLRVIGGSVGQTINAPISTNAGGTFGFLSAGGSGAYLRINGNVTGANNAANSLRLAGVSKNIKNEINSRIANGTGSGVLSVNKEDAGTWVLKGTNTYTGTTNINNGTLIVGAGGAGSLTSPIRVNSGTLGGSGGTSKSVTVGNAAGVNDSFISPGKPIGGFGALDGISFLSDGNFNVEINSSTRLCDKIVASGVTINSNSRLTVSDLGIGTMPVNTQFVIIDNISSSPISGTFLGFANGSAFTIGANRFQVSYSGGTGNDLVLTVVPNNAIPVFQSDYFVDSIGVGIHAWVGRGSGNAIIIKDKLVNAGVRNVRDWLAIDKPHGTVAWQLLRDNGIRICFTLTPNWGGIAAMKQHLISNDLVDCVEYLEGPNEPNSGSNWSPSTIAFCLDLFNRFKSDPITADIPILVPALALRAADMTPDHNALGDLSAYVDFGNSHPYPGGGKPMTNLLNEMTLSQINVGSKPMVVTETGYHNALSTTNGHNPASEAATALYLPRLYLEYFSKGVVRTYWFDLLDNFTEAEAAAKGYPDIEAHFGLVRYDFSDKPAYNALKNLISIMKDPGARFVPTPVSYTISGSADVKSLLFQRRDGKYQLAIWRDVSVWNNSTRVDIVPPSATITVTFPGPRSQVNVFFPTTSSNIANTYNNVTSVQIPLQGQVAILRF